MRQGHSNNNNNNNNNNKRMRGRNRKGPNPLARSYESNGPDVKIRGTALHVAEKYIQLARDASSSGDRVAEQSYLQHAEHYYRIVAAAQAQMPQQAPMQRADDYDDDEDGVDERGYDRPMQMADNRQGYNGGGNDQQPYVNGNSFNGNRDGGSDEGDGEGDDGEDLPMEQRPQPMIADGQGVQQNGAPQGQPGQPGEPHFRQRGRRSGRGRSRRPEGAGTGEFPLQPTAPVPQASGEE